MDVGKLFSFHGRVGRGAFWGLSFIGGVSYAVGSGMLEYASTNAQLGLGLSGLVLVLMGLEIQLATGVKRWHDRGKSGRWFFILFIPIIGIVWSLIELGFLPETDWHNEYGPSAGGSPFGNRVHAVRTDTLDRMKS